MSLASMSQTQTLPKLRFKIRDALLVAREALESQSGLTGQPNFCGMGKERHPLAFRDVIVGLLQFASKEDHQYHNGRSKATESFDTGETSP